MSIEWPREVGRRADGAGVVYELPVRPLGGVRWIGLGPIAFSLFFVWSPAQGLIGPAARVLNGTGHNPDWVELAFGGVFVLAGLIPAALGWMIAFGRCRVKYHNRQLRVVELVGPLRWTRQVSATGVRKLEVSFGARVNDNPVTQGRWADLGALVLYPDSGKPRLLVLGYPRGWLAAMARELSVLLNPMSGVAAAPAIPVEEKPVSPRDWVTSDDPAEVEQQPAGSPIRLEPRSDGLTLTVPPMGVWKGSKGLFFFALLWCGFMVVFTTAVVLGFRQGVKAGPWPMLVFAMVFWAIGLGLLAGAVNMGRRRALLVVDAAGLRVAQAGLFSAKRWEWRREVIADLRAGPSGTSVNDRPVLELQVHPRAGKKVGLLAGREDEELRWMATQLRRALGFQGSTRRPDVP